MSVSALEMSEYLPVVCDSSNLSDIPIHSNSMQLMLMPWKKSSSDLLNFNREKKKTCSGSLVKLVLRVVSLVLKK